MHVMPCHGQAGKREAGRGCMYSIVTVHTVMYTRHFGLLRVCICKKSALEGGRVGEWVGGRGRTQEEGMYSILLIKKKNLICPPR